MPALAPYIPARQTQFSAWLANFSSLITASPLSYGLVAGDATIIAGYNSQWVAAVTPVLSGNTRTPAAVSNKNTVLAQILPLIRNYAQGIARNPGVSSAAKIALGLNPQTSTPSAVSAPTSAPVLTFQSASIGAIILRYRDSAASVSVKAKPYGVVQLRLNGMVSATPVVNPALLPLLATPTKSPYLLSTAGMASGATLYLAGYWATRKGLLSPPSDIISVTVP